MRFSLVTARGSRNPSKQLFWFWFSEDMRKSRGFPLGLDLACGPMSNRGRFHTSSYTGVDLDEAKITDALRRFPECRAFVSTIEGVPEDVKGDFVVCVQTIGINSLYDGGETVRTLRTVLRSTKDGGALLFNIGPASVWAESYIDDLLRTTFGHVRKRVYGRWNQLLPKGSVWALISRMMAFAMYVFPPLRRGRHRFVYYFCSEKGSCVSVPAPCISTL